MNTYKKNMTVEALRFFFIVVVCMWHFYLSKPSPFYHGYLAVDFFFILSGFLTLQSFLKNPSKTPLTFCIGRFKRFFYDYFYILVICIFVRLIYNGGVALHLYDILHCIMAPLCDALMIQSIGVFNSVAGWHNNPMWYLSVLMAVSSLIYALLYVSRKNTIYVLLPILCLLGYTYIFNNFHQLEVWDIHGGVYMGLLRGFCDFGLGILTAAFFKSNASKDLDRLFENFAVPVFSLVVICLLFIVWEPLDQYSLFLFPILIICSFKEKNKFNCLFTWKGWGVLGGMSWLMFLIHYPILEIMDFYLPHINNPWLSRIVYISSVMAIAFIWFHYKNREIHSKIENWR